MVTVYIKQQKQHGRQHAPQYICSYAGTVFYASVVVYMYVYGSHVYTRLLVAICTM